MTSIEQKIPDDGSFPLCDQPANCGPSSSSPTWFRVSDQDDDRFENLGEFFTSLRKSELKDQKDIKALGLGSFTPVSIYDIQDILSNLPSLQRLDLSLGVVRDIPYERSLLPFPKRYSLQTLELSLFRCSPDLYPFYLAGILHLFDEIDELVLLDRTYCAADSIGADPMDPELLRDLPFFPPDLRVHSLVFRLHGFEPVLDKIAVSPICPSLTHLHLRVEESNILAAIQRLLNACSNLQSIYLDFEYLDAQSPNFCEEPIPQLYDKFLNLSCCKLLRNFVVKFPPIGGSWFWKHLFDVPKLIAKLVSTLPPSIYSVAIYAPTRLQAGKDVVEHGMDPLWSAMDASFGRLDNLTEVAFWVGRIEDDMKLFLQRKLSSSCKRCIVEHRAVRWDEFRVS